LAGYQAASREHAHEANEAEGKNEVQKERDEGEARIFY
jgi:hypothetical protein